MEVYQHMWDNFLLKVDKDQKHFKTKELLKLEYDPDWIVQHYYKQINEARLLLTALGETVTDEDLKFNAYATFEKHINLKEECWDWNRLTSTTWVVMRTHFSTEIQINKTEPAIMQQRE